LFFYILASHLTLIGSALAENGKNALQEIDFSGTSLSEKATRSLALSMVVKVSYSNVYNS